jgi:transposase
MLSLLFLDRTGLSGAFGPPERDQEVSGTEAQWDFADAAYLAQLLRLGLLVEGYIYPREERGPRDLARKRM